MRLVAPCGKLFRVSSRGFPLIRPNGLERSGRWQIEFGMRWVAEPFKAQTKATDAREELGDPNGLL